MSCPTRCFIHHKQASFTHPSILLLRPNFQTLPGRVPLILTLRVPSPATSSGLELEIVPQASRLPFLLIMVQPGISTSELLTMSTVVKSPSLQMLIQFSGAQTETVLWSLNSRLHSAPSHPCPPVLLLPRTRRLMVFSMVHLETNSMSLETTARPLSPTVVSVHRPQFSTSPFTLMLLATCGYPLTRVCSIPPITEPPSPPFLAFLKLGVLLLVLPRPLAVIPLSLFLPTTAVLFTLGLMTRVSTGCKSMMQPMDLVLRALIASPLILVSMAGKLKLKACWNTKE